MQTGKTEVFVLGATGFVGQEVVKEAVAQGYRVKALVRSAEKAAGLAAMGAIPVAGDAENPAAWVREAARCHGSDRPDPTGTAQTHRTENDTNR